MYVLSEEWPILINYFTIFFVFYKLFSIFRCKMQLNTQLLYHTVFQKVPGLTGLLTASNWIAFLFPQDSILYLM